MNILQMFSYPFMQRALIAGVLVSLCCALLGVSLVLKRYSMIGDGLSHVGFGALAAVSSEMTEALRGSDTLPADPELYAAVRREYGKVRYALEQREV